jgi:hypothetical protein
MVQIVITFDPATGELGYRTNAQPLVLIGLLERAKDMVLHPPAREPGVLVPGGRLTRELTGNGARG